MVSTLEIKCSKLTRELLAVLNRLLENEYDNGFQIMIGLANEDSEVPMPWDAWVDIKADKDGEDQLEIEGCAGASGWGYCKVVVPLCDADCYIIRVEDFDNNGFPPELAKHLVEF